LREVISEVIAEVMKSVCSQVLVKMKQVDVIIKEPMYRRASVDDFNLCFE
jgi:hypothetical protein